MSYDGGRQSRQRRRHEEREGAEQHHDRGRARHERLAVAAAAADARNQARERAQHETLIALPRERGYVVREDEPPVISVDTARWPGSFTQLRRPVSRR